MEEMALRYGQALYSLASDLDKIKSWQEEVKQIKGLLKDNPDFVMVLSSNFLSLDKRKTIVDETFVNLDENIKAFIKVIIDNNRTRYILDIFDSFNSLCNQHFNVLEGIIYSVEPLDEKYILKIQELISKKEKVSCELKNHIDKSLLGGLKVVINDHIYDDSIKHHLLKMKTTLLK